MRLHCIPSRAPTALPAGSVDVDRTVTMAPQEAAVLSGLRAHPNIVRFLGACEEPPAIVMELAGRSSLYDLLVRCDWGSGGSLRLGSLCFWAGSSCL